MSCPLALSYSYTLACAAQHHTETAATQRQNLSSFVSMPRSLGQNFLTDDSILIDIVRASGVQSGDLVLEVRNEKKIKFMGPACHLSWNVKVVRKRRQWNIGVSCDCLMLSESESVWNSEGVPPQGPVSEYLFLDQLVRMLGGSTRSVSV